MRLIGIAFFNVSFNTFAKEPSTLHQKYCFTLKDQVAVESLGSVTGNVSFCYWYPIHSKLGINSSFLERRYYNRQLY